MANRSARTRWVLTLVIGIAALMLLAMGAVASWTISTTNPGNSFATGSLHMLNGKGGCTDTGGTCTAILSATGMKPGGTAQTGTVTITNTGSLAGTYSLSGSESVSPAANTVCQHMDLTITDDATPTANTLYSGTIDNFVSTYGAAPLALTPDNPFAASTGAHTFTFSVSLDTASPSSEMSATCTAAFTWTAVPA